MRAASAGGQCRPRHKFKEVAEMTTRTAPFTEERRPREQLSRLSTPEVRNTLIVGMVAAMMFGMVEMAIEGSIHRAGFLDGFWSPVKYIAAVFTRGADTDPTYALVPVIVGLVGHMMNAMMFGAAFAYATRRIREPLTLTMAGVAYGIMIFIVMWYGLLVVLDPAMKRVNNTGFFFAHVIWGMLLGAGLAFVRRKPAFERR